MASWRTPASAPRSPAPPLPQTEGTWACCHTTIHSGGRHRGDEHEFTWRREPTRKAVRRCRLHVPMQLSSPTAVAKVLLATGAAVGFVAEARVPFCAAVACDAGAAAVVAALRRALPVEGALAPGVGAIEFAVPVIRANADLGLGRADRLPHACAHACIMHTCSNRQ